MSKVCVLSFVLPATGDWWLVGGLGWLVAGNLAGTLETLH